MTHNDEVGNADSLLAPAGQISDEDLEAVTGGLARPLGRDMYDLYGIDGESDAGHDDTSDG